MTTTAPTSYYGNLMVLSQGLARLGVDVPALHQQAGINAADYHGSNERIPWQLIDRVWELAVEHTGNPCLGLEVVEDLNPAVYRALGIALICSSSLRDFFQRFERFFAVISTLEVVEFRAEQDHAALIDHAIVDYSPSTIGCHSDAFAAFTLKFARMVYPDFVPVKVRLAWTPPKNQQARYEKLFGCPLEYGCKDSALLVSLDELDTPLVGANPDLAVQNDQLALTVLDKLSELDLPTKVYAQLIHFLPTGQCSRERVARSLAMSESAFQKKLKSAGTSYQEVLDKTRKELAQHHLEQQVSVDEVAYLLGFTDTSNFIRAFRRWTGTTPRVYRESVTKKTAS